MVSATLRWNSAFRARKGDEIAGQLRFFIDLAAPSRHNGTDALRIDSFERKSLFWKGKRPRESLHERSPGTFSQKNGFRLLTIARPWVYSDGVESMKVASMRTFVASGGVSSFFDNSGSTF